MNRKRKQIVWVQAVWPDGEQTVLSEIEGTNTHNLQGKSQGWVRNFLVGYNVQDGAVLTITIDEAGADEYARPDPE